MPDTDGTESKEPSQPAAAPEPEVHRGVELSEDALVGSAMFLDPPPPAPSGTTADPPQALAGPPPQASSGQSADPPTDHDS